MDQEPPALRARPSACAGRGIHALLAGHGELRRSVSRGTQMIAGDLPLWLLERWRGVLGWMVGCVIRCVRGSGVFLRTLFWWSRGGLPPKGPLDQLWTYVISWLFSYPLFVHGRNCRPSPAWHVSSPSSLRRLPGTGNVSYPSRILPRPPKRPALGGGAGYPQQFHAAPPPAGTSARLTTPQVLGPGKG